MKGSLDAGFIASPPSTLSKALQTAVLCPTFVANLLGNISVCLAVARVRSIRRRPSSPILASLAVSDLSMLPFLLFRCIWLYDLEVACKVGEVFSALLAVLLYVSALHICVLSCDRYVAIVYPLRYPEMVTSGRIKRILAVSWIVPLVSTFVAVLVHSDKESNSYRASIIDCSESKSAAPSSIQTAHLVFNNTFFIVIPFVVVLLMYGRITHISWYQNNRVEPWENLNPEMVESRRKRRREMKCMKTIAIVIGAFGLCYLPAVIAMVLSVKLGTSQVPTALRSTFLLMTTLNSALNPIIYTVRLEEFKQAFSNVFRRVAVMPQITITDQPKKSTTCTGMSSKKQASCGPLNEPPRSFVLRNEQAILASESRSEFPVVVDVGNSSGVAGGSLGGEDHILQPGGA